MRINLQGPAELVNNLAYRLAEAGIETSQGLKAPYGIQYDLNLYPSDELVLDGVEGPLETELLRQLEDYYPTPVKIARAGGIRSDLAMAIGVPALLLPQLEFCLLRTAVQLRNRYLATLPMPELSQPEPLSQLDPPPLPVQPSLWQRLVAWLRRLF